MKRVGFFLRQIKEGIIGIDGREGGGLGKFIAVSPDFQGRLFGERERERVMVCGSRNVSSQGLLGQVCVCGTLCKCKSNSFISTSFWEMDSRHGFSKKKKV